ncbi:Anti-sigma-K factor rskA [compost metagenome]
MPEHVWQGINARIEPQVLHIPEKRPFWNWLRVTAAIGSLVVAVALGVIYNRDSARYSATLLNADAQPALKVEAHEDYLKVEALSLAAVDQGRSLELWAIPADGKPIALAVSLEPKGGSPTGQPTGPVLYQGALAAL